MLRYWLSIFITFLIIRYVLPSVLRLVLSGFVRQQVRQAQQHTEAPFGPGASNSRSRYAAPAAGEGQVRVDYVPPTAKTTRPGEPKMGDYVDFEEV